MVVVPGTMYIVQVHAKLMASDNETARQCTRRTTAVPGHCLEGRRTTQLYAGQHTVIGDLLCPF